MVYCLLVDDSNVVRKAARRMLEELAITVDEARDGAEALAKCQEKIPDMILLDWNMPVMDGMEFFLNFKKLPNNETCKVIFCTTESEMSKIIAAMEQGASEYIMKPYDVEILRDKLVQTGILE
jgi:two-component system chemotaxis response regulator CheY